MINKRNSLILFAIIFSMVAIGFVGSINIIASKELIEFDLVGEKDNKEQDALKDLEIKFGFFLPNEKKLDIVYNQGEIISQKINEKEYNLQYILSIDPRYYVGRITELGSEDIAYSYDYHNRNSFIKYVLKGSDLTIEDHNPFKLNQPQKEDDIYRDDYVYAGLKDSNIYLIKGNYMYVIPKEAAFEQDEYNPTYYLEDIKGEIFDVVFYEEGIQVISVVEPIYVNIYFLDYNTGETLAQTRYNGMLDVWGDYINTNYEQSYSIIMTSDVNSIIKVDLNFEDGKKDKSKLISIEEIEVEEKYWEGLKSYGFLDTAIVDDTLYICYKEGYEEEIAIEDIDIRRVVHTSGYITENSGVVIMAVKNSEIVYKGYVETNMAVYEESDWPYNDGTIHYRRTYNELKEVEFIIKE